jgi:hypothetical protein
MTENSSSGIRTRHIDTRYHFVREHVEDRLILFLLNQESMMLIGLRKIWERKHTLNIGDKKGIGMDHQYSVVQYLVL